MSYPALMAVGIFIVGLLCIGLDYLLHGDDEM